MAKNYQLIKARKSKGYTQEQLAYKLERQKTTVCNWENGYSKPSLDEAYKVAKILETDINTLFFAKEVQESQTPDDEPATS